MKTILWLDDNEKLIDASVEVFREYELELVKATNVSRALTILREQKLDGVLLDVRLNGGESGLEFLREIHHRYPKLPVVVFTAFPDYIDQIIAKQFGADFYFRKVRKRIPVRARERRKFFEALHQIFDEASAAPHSHVSVKPLSIFCSYSHRDIKLRDRLEEHLSSLKQSGRIVVWHDRKISIGKEWAGEIDEHLNTADIILLLVSSSFMASDYCNDVEVKRAMERHHAHQSRVVPIILSPVDWQKAVFAKLQVLPMNAKPLTSWKNREEAFFDIARGIARAIEEISQAT